MQVRTRYITLEQYLSYGDQPIEVVNGEVIMAAAAHTQEQPNTVTNLMTSLQPYVRKNKLGKVFSEASFVLDGNPRSNWVSGARTPDVSFITRDRMVEHKAKYPDKGQPWWLAPDLAVEVVSPTDSYTEVSEKVADYLRYGIRLVWVIDPEKKAVRIHTPEEPLGHTLGEKDKLTAAPVSEGWSMKVVELFVED